MAEREGHLGRDIAFAGVGAGLGVASVLAWQRWTRQRSGAEREYVPVVWDPNLDPEAVKRALAEATPAAIDPFHGRRYKGYLAVLATDEEPPVQQLEKSATVRMAVAIQERRTGDWHVGVASDNDWFGERPGHADHATLAVHIGQPAISAAVLATVDQGEFRAFDTALVEISDVAQVLAMYPDVPLLQNHPIQK
jgi:hypothetical protein